MKAPDILKQAAKHIEDRSAARDQPNGGERSMGKTVDAFNAVTGHELSERDGWVFMQILKLARACNTASGLADDYEDAAAYAALAGEAASVANKEQKLIDARYDIHGSIVHHDGSVGVIDDKTQPFWQNFSRELPVRRAMREGVSMNVPDWANWIAKDCDGDWYAYDNRPVVTGRIWNNEGGQFSCIGNTGPDSVGWQDTLAQVT